MANLLSLQEPSDFSLVLGGPLYQLFLRARLAQPPLGLLRRRILVIALVAWLPLLLLSALGSHFLDDAIKVPFLYDIEAHVRFLIALPVLIVAELVVHLRIRSVIQQFGERGIVVSEDMPTFHAAIDWALRVRNSVAVEIGLLVFVYSIGHWVWTNKVALGTATWYASPAGGRLSLTFAGYWYVFVSIPIFQFILLRWYLRLVLWFGFLWRVSRLNLRLTPIHPDRAGGLGFLGNSSYAFAPILFAQGAVLAGLIASRVFYEGQTLMAFKVDMAGLVGFFVLCILGPLTMFTPRLVRVKRLGQREYGGLASRYVQGFEEKWIRAGAQKAEELLGSGDIQSLADLGNSYQVVREMRPVPFGMDVVARLVGATVAPMLPLTLTVLPLEELIKRLIAIVL